MKITFHLLCACALAFQVCIGSSAAAPGGEPAWVPATQQVPNFNGVFLTPGAAGLFAVKSRNVYVSSDNGLNWAAVGPAIPDPYLPLDFFTVKGSRFFLVTGSTGVLRAAAGDSAWVPMNSGMPPGTIVYTLAVSGNTLLAGTDHAVFASVDDGDHWAAASAGIPDGTTIQTICAAGTTLFAGNNASWRGVPASGGFTWTKDTRLYTDAVIAKGKYLFSAGIGIPNGVDSPSRVNRSEDDGVTWTAAQTGIPSKGRTIALAAAGENLFVGVRYAADTLSPIILRSVDNGASWTPMVSGLPPGAVLKSLVASGGDLLVATLSHGIWRLPAAALSILPRHPAYLNFPSSSKLRYRIEGGTGTVFYHLGRAGFANLGLYSTSGRLVALLVSGFRQAGDGTVLFSTGNLAGPYLLELQSGDGIDGEALRVR